MSIQIDRTKCVGCGQCAEICPGTLIRMTQKKAEMRYPMECWGCASCVKECPAHAISLYLGADIGGAGCRMTVNKDGIYKIVYDNITWEIPKFPTIHAAQFWALTSSDFIGTM